LRHLILGTAGHIDHGKTLLIKALSGIDCDTHAEEKKRGITINLGFAYLDLPSGDRIGIVDVPGHHDFISTMVGGASGIDFALLVVAADSGVMPQTREHLQIMDVLGIKRGLVAITKIDLVEPDIISLAEEEIEELIQGTFFEGCPVVAVSSMTGEGLEELRNSIVEVASQVTDRPVGEGFRMFIDRIFNVQGFGTVVTGSVLGGVLREGDMAYLQPGEKRLRVRQIERYGRKVEEVVAGDRAAINLVGLKREDFQRGMILSDRVLRHTKMLDARLHLFRHMRSFGLWNRVMFHLGTYEQQARIHLIDHDRITGGDTAFVQIHLDTPCIVQHDDRFVIRNTSSDVTLGGGAVIDAFPLHHKRRPEKLIESMTRISQGTLQELAAEEVKKRFSVITHREIADILNVSHDRMHSSLSDSLPEDIVSYVNDGTMYLLIKREHDSLKTLLLKRLASFHKRNPLNKKGRTTEELMGLVRIERGSSAEIVLRMLLEKLEAGGKLKQFERTWVLSSHIGGVSPELKGHVGFVEKFIRDCRMKTPLMSELVHEAQRQRINEDTVKNILRFLVENRSAYYQDGDYIHASVVDRCRTMLLKALAGRKDGMTVAEFRDLVHGNRKICLLLLGIYDAEMIVERSGDVRVLTEKGIGALNTKC